MQVRDYLAPTVLIESFAHLSHVVRDAFIVSSQLTGVSQIAGLGSALVLSVVGARMRHSVPALGVFGVIGTVAFGLMGFSTCPSSRADATSPLLLVTMVFMGIGQTGAVICSLGLLGECVLGRRPKENGISACQESNCRPESTSLLHKQQCLSYKDWKGSIAGTVFPLLFQILVDQPGQSTEHIEMDDLLN